MGLPNTVNQLFNGGSPYYIVNRSLRFRSSASAYLNRTPASASNRTTWTWSGWVKRGSLTADMSLFQGYSDANNYTIILLESADRIQIQNRVAATATFNWVTTAVYRDPSAWYHIVVTFDTTQATTTDRIKLYVNGVQVTVFSTQTTGAQNATGFINNNNSHNIGRSGAATQYFDGYQAEVNFIDGQALTPSSFGAFDTNGIWQPIKYTGTYGTNGFYLPFRNTTSTTTLVQDASGNGNNWTPNNISLTSGTTYDSMLDSPTVSNASSNYAVLNPLKSAGTNGVNSGNLNFGTTADGAGNSGDNSGAFGSIAVDSGKWYFEATKLNTTTNCNPPGFASTNCIIGTDDPGLIASGKDYFGFSWASGGTVRLFIRQGGVSTNIATGLTQAQNDVFALAIDLTNNTIAGYKNGVQQGSTTSFTATTNLIAPCLFQTTTFNYAGFAFNFGQRPFTYTPPSGYNALNTANLPQPTISYGAPYMNAVTYTGYGPLIPSGLGIPTKRNASTQNVSKSLRFRQSAGAYLSRTYGTPTSTTTGTISFWYKRGLLGSSQLITAFGTVSTTTGNGQYIQFNADNLRVIDQSSDITTIAKFTDPSAWYHIVVTVDTTQATAANRIKLYVNGVQITSFSSATYGAQNYASTLLASGSQYIGYSQPSGSRGSDGYMAECYFIDGQALTPSSFGETNSDGVWVPKSSTGTYGTNGFYLPFTNTTSTTTLVADSSGNGNNWTPNNISLTAGTTYDSMIDSPTDYTSAGNYAVINPLNGRGTSTVTDGNLKDTCTGLQASRGSSITMTSGKWYVEATITGSGGGGGPNLVAGIGVVSPSASSYSPVASGVGYYSFNGNKYISGVSSAYGTSWNANGGTYTLGMALDIDGGTIQFYLNGVGQGAITLPSSSDGWVFVWDWESSAGSGNANWNFGQRPFTYSAPSGYSTLNTYNITAPSKTWFSSANNSGRGSATAYPDFVWIKSRSSAQNHSLNDTLRGPTLNLLSNSTNAEAGASTMFSVNKYGLTLGNDASVNSSSYTDVMWGWQAGQGTTSTNTSGTITSTVSVNASAGFSIVKFTATGSTATVGHGLGVAPSMMIAKDTGQVRNWWVYQKFANASPASGYLYLNLTNAFNTDANAWNNTLPTSSVFSIGSTFLASPHVVYCFAPVAGYSAFGSYTGNGSADGPFIYTGFRPRFILFKNTTAYNWQILDTSRAPYNQGTVTLFPNLTDAENTTATQYDILSNGFKIRTSDAGSNGSGNTIIYAAFAESPFQIARAR